MSYLSDSARIRVIDPFSQMKRLYDTILDDANSVNRNNFVPSQSFTWCSAGNFSQGDQYKTKLLNGTETSFRCALISNNCHSCHLFIYLFIFNRSTSTWMSITMRIMLILIWLTRGFKAKAWKVRRLLTEMTNQPTMWQIVTTFSNLCSYVAKVRNRTFCFKIAVWKSEQSKYELQLAIFKKFIHHWLIDIFFKNTDQNITEPCLTLRGRSLM